HEEAVLVRAPMHDSAGHPAHPGFQLSRIGRGGGKNSYDAAHDRTSDHAFRAVPLVGPAQALVQTDAGLIPQIALGLVDLEGAILPAPADPERKELRRDSERLAAFLDAVPDDDDGPDRQMNHA